MLAGPRAPSDSHETFSSETGPVNADLVLFSDGKGSAFFNRDRLIEQSTFEDADFMTVQKIQDFLVNTPYGHASFLSTYQWNGNLSPYHSSRVSSLDINPLIIWTKYKWNPVSFSEPLPILTWLRWRWMWLSGCGSRVWRCSPVRSVSNARVSSEHRPPLKGWDNHQRMGHWN